MHAAVLCFFFAEAALADDAKEKLQNELAQAVLIEAFGLK